MTVVCYGDSNTWGYDPRSFLGDRYDHPWPEYLGELTGWEMVNAGSCGRRVPRQTVELPADADLVLVMLGTNDLLNGDEPESVAHRMEAFLKTIGPVHIALVAPPALCRGEWVGSEELVRRSKELANAYRKIAGLPGVRFIDPQEWSIPPLLRRCPFYGAGPSDVCREAGQRAPKAGLHFRSEYARQ